MAIDPASRTCYSQGLASDTTLLELGAIAARISGWKADLSKLLLGFEQVENALSNQISEGLVWRIGDAHWGSPRTRRARIRTLGN
jgi:hypothetical protein